MRIRATLKIRNDLMIAAREKLGMSVADIARACKKKGLSTQTIYDFERLKYQRVRNPEILFEYAASIAAVLGLTVDDVLPEKAIGMSILSDAMVTKNVDFDALLEWSAQYSQQLLTVDAPDVAAEKNEAAELLHQAMKSLTFREREVLTQRYGLNSSPVLTLDEVGKKMRVTRERVRQIETKAVRKLQHPATVGKMLEALD